MGVLMNSTGTAGSIDMYAILLICCTAYLIILQN